LLQSGLSDFSYETTEIYFLARWKAGARY